MHGLLSFFNGTSGRSSHYGGHGAWIVLAFSIALTLPCLVFRYLPMVDLPQHEAIVSMMLQLHNRKFGFDSYYSWAPTRTLYIAPYALAVVLARLMSLRFAMHAVVFCAVIAYPVGILLCLRALGRPAHLGLLAMPLVYNQSFFWGFINFNFAIGLAFITLALLIGNWSRRRALSVVLLSILVSFTHVYGLILLGLYVGLWFAFGERRLASKRLVAMIPAGMALILWLYLLSRAHGFSEYKWRGLFNRWSRLPESIAGGWRDHTEVLVLCGLGVAIGALSCRTAPVTTTRWKKLSGHQRVIWAFIGLNLLLYFGMPELSIAANKASFRHAEIAALALPLTLNHEEAGAAPNWARLFLVGLAFCVVVLSWYHFTRFDKEARSFDAIIDAVPERSRIAQLTYDRHGQVARAPVYLHFAAYAQADKGGFLAVSFPAQFWNIPMTVRSDVALPLIPKGLEWNPLLFGNSRLGEYFDYVIVRASRNRRLSLPQPFPYQLQLQNGSWWLLRRYESSHE